MMAEGPKMHTPILQGTKALVEMVTEQTDNIMQLEHSLNRAL